jgi:hypothetical protein
MRKSAEADLRASASRRIRRTYKLATRKSGLTCPTCALMNADLA